MSRDPVLDNLFSFAMMNATYGETAFSSVFFSKHPLCRNAESSHGETSVSAEIHLDNSDLPLFFDNAECGENGRHKRVGEAIRRSGKNCLIGNRMSERLFSRKREGFSDNNEKRLHMRMVDA